jgi:hypothetical protein
MANIYEIRLKEHLDDCWARRFDDWVLSHNDDGTTVLVGPVRDQAALHGLLCRVRDPCALRLSSRCSWRNSSHHHDLPESRAGFRCARSIP